MILRLLPVVLLVFCYAGSVFAGDQAYESMSASTKLLLTKQISAPMQLSAVTEEEKNIWLGPLLDKFPKTIPDSLRPVIATTILYESKRAGLDPVIVLGLISVESNYRKYAISSAGARGLMQVMPFWIDVIGTPSHNLFDIRTNIRYGCVILRHYLDMENGNLTRALARYNGAIKKENYAHYPASVFNACKKWQSKL